MQPGTSISISIPGLFSPVNFPCGSLTILQGDVGTGKSDFLRAAAESAFGQGYQVAYFDCDSNYLNRLSEGIAVFQPKYLGELSQTVLALLYDLIIVDAIHTLPSLLAGPLTIPGNLAMLVSTPTPRRAQASQFSDLPQFSEAQRITSLVLEINGVANGVFDVKTLKSRDFTMPTPAPTLWDFLSE